MVYDAGMTIHTRALTQRIPIAAGERVGMLLCARNWHDPGRWEVRTYDLTEGRKTVGVFVQVRECIRCGHAEIERI